MRLWGVERNRKMAFIFFIIIVYIIACFLAKAFKQRVVKMFEVAICLIISILYLFGFFNNLQLGVYFICFLAVVFFLYLIKCSFQGTIVYADLMNSTCIVYFGILFLCMLLNAGIRLNQGDEFTHWGTTVKIMYQIDAFSNEPGTALYFLDYPPGTALLQYFIEKLSIDYSEDLLRFAQCTMLITPLVEALDSDNNGYLNMVTTIISALVLLFIPGCFYSNIYNVYCSLLVDAVLGVFFAYVLYNHYQFQMSEIEYLDSKIYFLKQSLAFFVLNIIKPSGVGLSSLAMIWILIDIFLANKDNQKKSAMCIVIAWIIGITSIVVWKVRLQILGYNNHFDTSAMTATKLLRVLANKGEPYQQETLVNFNNEYLGFIDKGFYSPGIIMYSFLFLCMSVLAGIVYGRFKKFIYAGFISVAIYIIYSQYMLLLYLFSFSPKEAVALASFRRYEYTIIMGIVLFFAMMIVSMNYNKLPLYIDKVKCYFVCYLFLALVVVLCLPNAPKIWISNKYQLEYTDLVRNQFDYISEYKDILNRDDKVYIIAEDTSDFGFWVPKYELIPAHSQQKTKTVQWEDVYWDLGKKIDDSSRKRDVEPEVWMNELEEEYTYVLLVAINEEFIDRYGGLFETKPEARTLYKVDSKSLRKVK